MSSSVKRFEQQVCGAVYVGQTRRTMRSRIVEHAKGPESHVHTHMMGHNRDNSLCFKWRILDIRGYLSTRLAMEAMHIKRFTNNSLMNNCDGAVISPFLAWPAPPMSLRPFPLHRLSFANWELNESIVDKRQKSTTMSNYIIITYSLVSLCFST